MELFLFVAAMIALPVLAVRFGVDSRHGYTATGHDLAWTGTRPGSVLERTKGTPRRVRAVGGIPARTPSGVVPEPPADAGDWPLPVRTAHPRDQHS